ncbi:MAG: trigger factor [Pirellulales bacterium]
MTSTELDQAASTEGGAEEAKTLQMDVKVDTTSACERHVVVTIPRGEVDRYMKNAFDEVSPKAELPGFRAGKAPRKLIETRFKAEVLDQVKSSLVMESLQQVTEGGHFSAISEPNFDYKAIEIPSEGDFRYEFTIEVRPDFDTPKWEGLALTRPVCELTNDVIDKQTARTLARFMPGEPVDGEAQSGDTLTVDMTFTIDGKEVSKLDEEIVYLRPTLTFGDATIEGFDNLMAGVKEGETREAKTTIADSAPNEEFRGKEVTVSIKVTEIRRIVVDEIDDKLLDDLGFDNAEELRDFVRVEIQRQFDYHQQQKLRKQIVEQLTKDANWDMPESLVARQTSRELQRMVLELQRSGFSKDQIAQYINASRANTRQSTISALREHFVLEKIAEDLKLEPTAEDYDKEVDLLAEQSDMSPRRIRARLEKTGQMDAIRNQIIERQVIEKITEVGKITDEQDASFLNQGPDSSNLDFVITGEAVEIPEAKHDNDAAAFPGAPKLPEAEKKD